MGIIKIYSLGKFDNYNTILLSIFTIPCIRAPALINLLVASFLLSLICSLQVHNKTKPKPKSQLTNYVAPDNIGIRWSYAIRDGKDGIIWAAVHKWGDALFLKI